MATRRVKFDPELECTIEARRSGGWWAVTVPELRGVHSRLARLRVEVDALTRKAAHEMSRAGIPVRDIAKMLGASFQHAAKLAKRAHDP